MDGGSGEHLNGTAAAACFGVSGRTLDRWAEQGHLRRTRVGASWIYAASDIAALLEQRYATVLARRQKRNQVSATSREQLSYAGCSGVADDLRWVRTEVQLARMHEARAHGVRCGWCGRSFQDGEPVIIEQFRTGEKRRIRDGALTHRTISLAPVGLECASPEFLQQMDRLTPDICADCRRPVYYRRPHWRQRDPGCSRRCSRRAQKHRQSL